VKSEYGKIPQKQQILLKTYAANYNRLLNQALNELDAGLGDQNMDHLAQFYANAPDVVRCCIPFKVYSKKLAFNSVKVCVSYSSADKAAIVLSFSQVRHLIAWSQDPALFEMTLKRMYNEFTAQCKSGGGGFGVLDRLRISQNCFVELLSWNRAVGYQLGF